MRRQHKFVVAVLVACVAAAAAVAAAESDAALSPAPAPAPAAAERKQSQPYCVLLDMPPRFQWTPYGGYCGETSLQMVRALCVGAV